MKNRLSNILTSAQTQLAALVASWSQSKRLYNLEGEGPVQDLMVEQFTLVDTISEPFVLQLSALTLDARFPLNALKGRRLTLTTRLADGRLHRRSGLVFSIAQRGSDGGFLRLQLTIQPWITFLAYSRHSRAWQHKTVPQILDHVFSAYRSHAAWRFGEVAADGSREALDTFLAQGPNAGVLDYCCQYRETDLAFVQRLLASVGLGWRIEEDETAPSGHTLVVFADSRRWPANDTAPIRFHRSAATEEQDTIQAFGGQRRLNPAATALLQWDYQQKRSVATVVPTHHTVGAAPVQDMAPWLERYRHVGTVPDGSVCTLAQLQHLATLGQEAHEFRNKGWLGRSTVRSLRAGQWFTLDGSPLEALDRQRGLHDPARRQFIVHTVHALGVNNLPRELGERLVHDPAANPFAELDGRPRI